MSRIKISTNSLMRSLGYDTSYISIITSLILAVISFFYIYIVAAHFRMDIFFFHNRITYEQAFNNFLISGYLDHIVIASGLFVWLIFSLKETRMRYVVTAIFGTIIGVGILSAHLDVFLEIISLLSIPLCASFLIYNKFSITKRKFLNAQTSLLYINYLGLVAITIAITSTSSILSMDLHLFNQPSYLAFHDNTYQIFDLISDVSPIVIFLLVGCIPVKLIIETSRKAFLRIKKKVRTRDLNDVGHGESAKRSNNNTNAEAAINDVIKIRTPTIIICLSLAMLLSIILGIIPHIPTVNRDNQQIGTDSDSYVNWTNALVHSNNVVNFTKQAFLVQSSGERPLSLVFTYSLIKLLGGHDSLSIIEHLPLILGPLLVLVTYFLTRELTASDKTSLLASFLSAVSFQTMIGIYAGYYANWIGIIVGYASFVFVLRFLKKRTKSNLALFLVLVITMLLSHQYTWTVFAAVMLVFLIVMIFMRREFSYNYSRTAIVILMLIVLLPVVLETARTIVIGSSGGIMQDVAKAQAGLGAHDFELRWNTLKDTVFVYLGGQLSNSIILFLGLYWLFISKFRELSSVFIFIFLSIGIIPIFFGDQLTQGRILFDIPFQIPAALALVHLTQRRGSVVLLPVCIWLVVISVRAVANFYYVPPPF